MIDRGISEEYVAWWLEAMTSGDAPVERVEQTLSVARIVARHGAGGRSLIELYEAAMRYYNGSPVLAAESLRRALQELATPTPIEDGLPPPDSPVWEYVYATPLLAWPRRY